uniref:HDC14560 n=1 Tax=Drosophila melanogaster TaxID=7227 RepID=Q6IJN6_DROME|nr:TPA_inf: HDC14560 [Drosophila melanogaster]
MVKLPLLAGWQQEDNCNYYGSPVHVVGVGLTDCECELFVFSPAIIYEPLEVIVSLLPVECDKAIMHSCRPTVRMSNTKAPVTLFVSQKDRRQTASLIHQSQIFNARALRMIQGLPFKALCRRNGKFEDLGQNDTLINEMANIRKPTTSQSWSTKIEEKWSQWNQEGGK